MRNTFAVLLAVLIGAMAFGAVAAQDDMAEDAPVVNVLPIVEMDGIPEGVEAEAWADATVIAVATQTEDGVEVTIFGAELVPEGLYTTWAVNEGLVGMDVAPAGGTPANEFRANEDGFGVNTIIIPADEVPDALALAYHSDDQTYGDNPGPMGEVSFTHVMGGFPVAEEME
jgi:hypothetical protein